MEHVDPDQLALLALGESVASGDGSVTGHLRQCGHCRDELESLQHTADLAREAVDHRDTAPPSEAVWSRIASEVGIGRPAGPVVPAPRYGQHRAAVPASAQAQAQAPGPAPAPAPLRSGRRPGRRWVRPVAALVAAAAIGVTGTLGAVRPWRSDPAPVTTSAATLTVVAGGPGGVQGRAVVERGPGGPVLRVTAAGLPLQQGYYEVWVFDGERSMVSIGVLGADSTASLPLPPTLDLRRYHVVDISQEQYDGEQTHSPTSVLRGSLTG